MGTFDDAICLDRPPGLGEALGAYKSQLAPSMILFPFKISLVSSLWRVAAKAAGARSGTLPAQSRSCWKSSANCRRYAQSGQGQRSLAKLDGRQ